MATLLAWAAELGIPIGEAEAAKTTSAAKPAKAKAEPKTEAKSKGAAEPAPAADAPKKRARTKKDE